MKVSRNNLRLHRKGRVRAKVKGTAQRPRLCVFRSLLRIEAQLIDDITGQTLAQTDSKKIKVKNDIKGAEKVGELIAKLGKEKKLEAVVFDRGAYKYHGRVKALADGARKGGLKF